MSLYSRTFSINDIQYNYTQACTYQEYITYFKNTILSLLKQGTIITKLKLNSKNVTKSIWEGFDTFYTLSYPYDKDVAFDIVFNPSSSHAIFVNSQIEVIRDLLQGDAEMVVNSVFTKVAMELQNIDLTNPDAKEIVTDVYLIYNKLKSKNL